MPLMDGVEAARRIKGHLPNVRIVLFTLHSKLLRTEQLAKSGISAMVSKDEATTELIPTVRSLLRLFA